MTSIRTKTTLLTICEIVITITVATLLGITAIRNIGNKSSDRMLHLLCESGEKNLDYYFESVEQSVEMVSAYVESDLEGLTPKQLEEYLPEHLENVKDIFTKMVYQTNGVLTYYYRIDPAFTKNAKGFWFVNLDGEAFIEHEVTDITLYDVEDTSALVWFTVPRSTGKPIWLPPYITDNLDVRVISYNTPIYLKDIFIGVIGIEIDYSTMAEQVDHITLYENGYAFINDSEGTIIYHPKMDVTTMSEHPKVPKGLLSNDAHIRYKFDGVEKQAVWLPLHNGMRLNVTVPVSEINADWHSWIYQITVVSIVLLAVFVIITFRFTGHITKPLHELTESAEQVNKGNYDCKLDYKGNDEVGILTKAFNNLISHLKVYISDLNDLAYADALTSVHNKGAFDKYTQNIQDQIDKNEKKPEFGIIIFDCNGLKTINDTYGHDKGNLYLKNTCQLICDVFNHSPVFRIGGDEFTVILQNQDYHNRTELLKQFDKMSIETQTDAENPWKPVNAARGLAVYDPSIDENINDVIRRADKLMYEDKWIKKNSSNNSQRN
ncbi:MAG: diguanylate cyclase [Anaerolineaceae bacterium]|nr:diguanylate cyclase [Anaerolineaceae bacterium]